MFKAVMHNGKLGGYSYKDDDGTLFFFGAKHLLVEGLKVLFPNFEFCYLKQQHGGLAVEAEPSRMPEADAQFTTVPGRALVIQTADCLPLLLSQDGVIGAAHAGWRGAVAGIVQKTVLGMQSQGPLLAAIGPHIQARSFEVGDSVAETLYQAVPPGAGQRNEFVLPHVDPLKAYFNLSALVFAQLYQAINGPLEIMECAEDTLTNPDFHSYRRDGPRAGRQFSFVVLQP